MDWVGRRMARAGSSEMLHQPEEGKRKEKRNSSLWPFCEVLAAHERWLC